MGLDERPGDQLRAWDWDTASTAEAWRHSHNYIHHTYTNIIGKDRDLGYEIMRIDPDQPWHPVYLLQPFYNILLSLLFEWGVAVHDLDFDAIRAGEKDPSRSARAQGDRRQGPRQIVKDYIAWPLISGLMMTAIEAGVLAARRATRAVPGLSRKARRACARLAGGDRTPALAADRPALVPGAVPAHADRRPAANLIRNVWSYAIIFCGHFPDQSVHLHPGGDAPTRPAAPGTCVS